MDQKINKDQEVQQETEETVEAKNSTALENDSQSQSPEQEAPETVDEAPENNDAPEEVDPVAEVAGQLADAKDRILRLMAEFDNYRKRTTKEQASSFEKGEICVVEAILPVIDNFERAIEAGKKSGLDQDDAFYKGIVMTYDQMMSALKALGVVAMDDLGKSFDPNFHNAMQHVEDEEHGEDEIVAVFQKGYKIGETLIRPSLVKVAN